MSWLDENRGWLTRAERWLPRQVEPLRVRAWFKAPVVWDDRDPITLEGPLQFVVVVRETGRLPDDVFHGIERDGAVDIPIPLADEVIGDLPIACASWGMPPWIAVPSRRWRRKRPRAEAYNVTRLQVAGGWAKNLNIPVPTLVTPWLDFFVRGDRALIEELLRDMGGLGRDSTRGPATVLGYEVTSDPEDRSLRFEDRPQRAIPFVMDGGPWDPRSYAPDGFEERAMATRAPYWATTATETVCACPSLRISRPDAFPLGPSGMSPTGS